MTRNDFISYVYTRVVSALACALHCTSHETLVQFTRTSSYTAKQKTREHSQPASLVIPFAQHSALYPRIPRYMPTYLGVWRPPTEFLEILLFVASAIRTSRSCCFFFLVKRIFCGIIVTLQNTFLHELTI